MSKLIKDSLLQIIHKNEEATVDKRVGTGFLINSSGYFITARHCILPHLANISKVKVIHQDREYGIKHIQYIQYANDSVDILIYQIDDISQDFPFVKLENIPLSNIDGEVRLYGFPNNNKKIKSKKFNFYGEKDSNYYEITHNKDIIKEGCSGSPVVLLEDNKATSRIIGVMSYSSKDESKLGGICPIDKVKELNYRISEENKSTQEDIRCDKYHRINLSTKMKLITLGSSTLFNILHENIEHELIKIEQKIERTPEAYCKEDFWLDLKIIITGIQQIFEYMVGEVSVNLKLFTQDLNVNDKIFVHTVARVAGKHENPLDRYSDEYFEILYSTPISNLKSIQDFYNNNNTTSRTIKVNSAYNEACYSSYKFWFCNDLPKATKEDIYYSGSHKYNTFYNSLFVLTIFEKNPLSPTVDITSVKGFLIIDSPKIDCFNEEHMKNIGGYLTHKLNRFLSNPHLNKFFK